ncbi:hypothetical protein AYM40_33885 [Paraburkholderia phytofirmans OLGA172]|uniref:Uncharacterized protein n=1 Tax=Paraburkholderia phytofirmans OLGA172 TaxID=1417228 RepID=A0A160FVQ6_9BURK|nr:glycosyltransferase [Paraburkholderia phytofirmans]ANB77106.1 hypothetical protein AYM40_33885 [Paraburkholderia phytofirmans OLGA172]
MTGEKVKSLFLMQDIRGGGAELVTLNVVSGIVASGGAARIHLLNACRVDHDLPSNLVKIGRSVVAQTGNYLPLLQAIRDCDVLVGALEIKTHIVSIILGLIFRRPVVLWLHKDLAVFLAGKNWFVRLIYKALFSINIRFSRAIVAVSDGVAKSLNSIYPWASIKIRILNNPVNLERIDQILSNRDVEQWLNRPFILAVGRLTWQKGFDLLLESFAIVSRQFPEFKLVILGEGEERAALEERVVKLGLSGRVLMPGFKSPYLPMSRASVLAMSSRFEGLPTVLIEALYLGIKIVSTDCPSGPAEVLSGGLHGKLVPADSVEAFANALIESLSAVDTSETKQARKMRAADFSFDRIVPDWERTLKDVSSIRI